MQGRPFTLEEERFLITQLSHGDDRTATKALQWLCDRLRAGCWSIDASKLRTVIRFCLHRGAPNARRWAVNALAEIGTGGDLSPILALTGYTEADPDLLAAIVGTIFATKPEEEAIDLLAKTDISLNGLALIAASRFSAAQKRHLIETRVPLETSDPAELRAAIVLYGTKNAPEHMFDQRHTNAIALSELNLHDVSSVSKYSIWAIAQLELGFSLLKIPISGIESNTAEVRKWMLRLLFSDKFELNKNLDIIQVARKDASTEVREESAIGLRDTYVPGIERYIIDWLFREDHRETHAALLDHMAAQSGMTTQYGPIVTELYRKASVKSDERVRIEAAAAKTDLYRELRKIDIEDEGGKLFANDNELRGISMVQINQNFTNAQIGSVTGTGTISAETINAVNGQTDAVVRLLLDRIVPLLTGITAADKRAEGEAIVQQIASAPTKGNWQKLLGFLNGVKDGAVAVGGIAEGVDGLIGDVSDLVNLG